MNQEKQILEKQLWAVANLLYGKMNADEYRNYILGFIFFKFLSEKQDKYAADILAKENKTFLEIKDNSEYLKVLKNKSQEKLGYFLEPTELFSYLVKKGNKEFSDDDFILEDLKKTLNDIENTSKGTESEDDFAGLFNDIDLDSNKLGKGPKAQNSLIVEVMSALDEIDFDIENSNSDILGDAYEYLISKFASGAGKSAGEFYTPAQISKLLSTIVSDGREKIKSVYDPACGSGSLLLKIGKMTKVNDYFGQENNPTTHNLARMNMILRGIHFRDFNIRHGDTLTDDQFPDKKFEVIVANPPFSLPWKSDSDPVLASDERFSEYGKLAPKNKADYAFITHMISHLEEDGIMAVVLPHGVLFRGGAEGTIRKHIVEKQNYLDAVIGLPSNLFFGVSIPATILVFKKNRGREDIIFIEASKEFKKDGNKNYLQDKNIEKIFNTYKERKEIEKFSHIADFEEIKENDFNLNITRYVDTFEEEDLVDIEQNLKDLEKLNPELEKLEEKMDKYLRDLGIK